MWTLVLGILFFLLLQFVALRSFLEEQQNPVVVEVASKAVCDEHAGYHPGDGGTVGMHILHTLAYHLPKNVTSVSLGCIRLDEEAIIPEGCPEVRGSRDKSGNTFDWFYLARSGRYLVLEVLQQRLLGLSTQQPYYLETRVLEDLENQKLLGSSFQKGNCSDEVVVFNRAAWQTLSDENTDYNRILQSAQCHPMRQPKHRYQEYTEIRTNHSDRVHAIVHNQCVFVTPPTTEPFDIYYLRNHPPPINLHPGNQSICESGHEGPEGYKALTEKIRVSSSASQQRKVLCMVPWFARYCQNPYTPTYTHIHPSIHPYINTYIHDPALSFIDCLIV